jgi:arylsulfatase A-like enzyme
MQGRSLVPFVRGQRVKDWRQEFFYEHHTMTKIIPEIEGVRNERWKYVRWMNATPMFEELFDLSKDPQETRNLVGEKSAQKQLVSLRQRWQELSERCR